MTAKQKLINRYINLKGYSPINGQTARSVIIEKDFMSAVFAYITGLEKIVVSDAIDACIKIAAAEIKNNN